MRRLHWLGALKTSLGTSLVALGALLTACGPGNEQMSCDATGCMICDGYGCRPTTPQKPQSCDSATTTCSCEAASDCSSGLSCVDGLCLHACEYSSQCGSQRVCVNGKCVVGCDGASPCPSGQSCSSKGTCEKTPGTPGCSTSQPCAGGMVCVQGECHGSCTANTGCAQGEICEASTGACIVDPQPMPLCKKDPSVCASGSQCIDGYCKYPCSDSTTCKLTDARIPICASGVCTSETEAKPQCTSKAQCSAGQDCISNLCK